MSISFFHFRLVNSIKKPVSAIKIVLLTPFRILNSIGSPKINQSCHIRLDQTTATSNAECHGTSSSTDAVSDNAWFNDATKVLFMDCPGKMAVNKTGANNSATSHGRRMSTVEESIFEDPINNHLSNTNLQPNSPDKSNTIVETNDACNNIEYNCNFDVSYHVPSSSSLESLRWSNSDEDDVKGDGSNKCQSVTNNASTKALEPEDPDEINPSSGSATATSPSVGNPCKGIDYDLDVSHNLSSSSSLESYRWKRSEEDGIQDVGFNIGESVASNSVSPLNGKEQCVTNLSSGLSTAKTTVAETQTSLPLERNHQKVVVPVAKKTVILRREMPVLQMAYLTKPTGIYRQMPPPLQPAPRMFYKRAMAYRAGFHKMGNVPKYITSAPTLDQKATKSSPEGALLPGKEANKSCHTTRTHAPQAVPFIKALTPARMHRFWPSIESNVSSKIPIYSGAANSCVGHSQQPQQQQQQPQHHQQQPQQPPQKLAANDGENNNNGDVNLNFINLEHNDDTKRYKRTRSSNIIDYQKSKEKVRKLGLTSRKEAKDIKTSGICKPVAVVVQKLNIAEYDERNKPKPSSSTKI